MEIIAVAGYDARFVIKAVGGRSQTAHHTGIERRSQAGAVPSAALAVNTEVGAAYAGARARELDPAAWSRLAMGGRAPHCRRQPRAS